VALGLLDAVLVRLVRLVMRRVILRLGHPESLLLLLLVNCGSTEKSGDEQSNQEKELRRKTRGNNSLFILTGVGATGQVSGGVRRVRVSGATTLRGWLYIDEGALSQAHFCTRLGISPLEAH